MSFRSSLMRLFHNLVRSYSKSSHPTRAVKMAFFWSKSQNMPQFQIIPRNASLTLRKLLVITIKKYALPIFMSKSKPGRVEKIDCVFTRNLLSLLIWKHMTGDCWFKTTALCSTRNPHNHEIFQRYERYFRDTEPYLYQ